MKKADLYRSIDTIKQDKCLKEHIMQAVSEKEKAAPVKRPVFIPVMIALLMCLNFGMAAKLVIFNKSQVNMSEFKARASISSSRSTSQANDELLQDEISKLQKDLMETEKEHQKLEQEKLEQEINKQNEQNTQTIMNNAAFDDAKDKFLKESEYNLYEAVEEWTSDSLEQHKTALPYFLSISNKPNDQSQKYTFRRYVQYIYLEEGQSSSGYAYTNHEYIIGYEGGFEPENIVSVTESAYKNDNVDIQLLNSAYSKMLDNNVTDHEFLESRAVYIAEESFGITSSSCTISPEIYYMFPLDSSGSANVYLSCKSEVSAAFDADGNGGGSYSSYFILDKDGNDVTEEIEKSFDYYWDTTYIYMLSGYTIIPDIIGMTADEAETALTAAGLSLGTMTYEENTNNDPFKPGEIMSYTVDEMFQADSLNMALKGQKIDIVMCGDMMPYLAYKKLTDAIAVLESKDITDYEINYPNQENRMDDSSYYVVSTSPENGQILSGKHVVLYVDIPDSETIAELLGKAINLDASSDDYLRIYSSEETKNLIPDPKPAAETSLDLTELGLSGYENTVFYGRYYESLFYITSFKTTSKDICAIPYLKCGLDKYTVSYSVKTDYYENRLNNFIDIDEHDHTDGCPDGNTHDSYLIDYKHKQQQVYATIKMDNNKIKEIEATIDQS